MSGAFVLDSSVALAWCFRDEATAASDALLERLPAEPAVVPSLWPVELANVLVMGERRGRLDPTRSAAFLEMIASLPIEIDPASVDRPPADLMALARTHRLTAYDATYLDLALRRNLPLATRDAALARAAAAAGAALLAA